MRLGRRLGNFLNIPQEETKVLPLKQLCENSCVASGILMNSSTEAWFFYLSEEKVFWDSLYNKINSTKVFDLNNKYTYCDRYLVLTKHRTGRTSFKYHLNKRKLNVIRLKIRIKLNQIFNIKWTKKCRFFQFEENFLQIFSIENQIF